MAETEINVVNRPTVLATAWGTFVQAWPILVVLVPAVYTSGTWLNRLDSRTSLNGTDIAAIRTENAARDARATADQKAISDRVDKIVSERVTDIQRLATVEEAVKQQGSILRDISSKLDRVLMGGRGR